MATVASTQDRARKEGGSPNKLVGRILTYVLMIILALIFMLPLFWMLSTSLKPKAQLFSSTIHWIPITPSLVNYQMILANPAIPIARWFLNSLIVAISVTVLILIVDSLAAYAYARMEFPGKKILFAILISTLFLPGMMFLVPNFLTINSLHLLNNYLGVIIPGLAGIFGVFFLRQFFESIPKELEEAATIDGANVFQIFFQVVLPLAKPALATLAVITFLASWNDFLWPLLILQDSTMLTLPPGLRNLQGAYTSEYGQMMAGSMIAAVPVLLLYVALQRYIVQSVASTGIKG